METFTTNPLATTDARRSDGYLGIEQYAAIGDGRTLALVGSDGSIDWMCLPAMDGSAVFGALLDPVSGGSFSLAPAIPYQATRRYLPQTNVLESEFTTATGVVRVTEAMTLDPSQAAPPRELVRSVEGLSGEVPMGWRLRRRREGGPSEPTRRSGLLVWQDGPLQIALSSWDAGEPAVSADTVSGDFVAAEGRRALLVLSAGDGVGLQRPRRDEVEHRLQTTAELWRSWVQRSSYDGPWRDAVERSLLAIRLLTDDATGAIAAAGTTSLPEAIGGERNFDYRFAWVRDLSFTAEALLRVGMRDLAHSSVTWLLGAVAHTHPRVDPVYALGGDVIRSQHRSGLPGYRGSTPVLVGNQAGSQLQLGGFGDLVEAVWRYADDGHILSAEVGERLADSADLLCAIWSSPDAGLWELGTRSQYMTSKLGCWTALERTLDLVRDGQVPARHVSRWRGEHQRIRSFIETQLWSDEQQSYLMKAGSEALDCGVLLASRRGFTDPGGPRMTSTIAAIESELRADGPLLYRYSGMREQENAFLACSFWMVEALALAGRRDEAAQTMDAMVSLGNDVGLYSEEMHPGDHTMRGNFPQALTHLALISAAAILADSGSDSD